MEVLHQVDTPPQKQTRTAESGLILLLLGPLIQRSICFVTAIGIPDLLAEGPRTADELAGKTKTHAPSLYRILRALAGAGIFKLNSKGQFELTPMAEPLRSDVPYSLKDFVMMQGTEWFWNVWGQLDRSVTTGQTAQTIVYGKGVFDFLDENKEVAEIFNRAMTSYTLQSMPSILEAYDFSGIKTLVDIGGGQGILLARILQAYPGMKGILFDLPSLIEHTGSVFKEDGILDRVQFVSGDFFKEVPKGADAYVLKFIVHDWDDETNRTILKNISSAMNRDSKLLIVESVIPEGNEPSLSKIRDLQMLIITGGKERTVTEYRTLLQGAGLRLSNVYATTSPLSIIEAVKE